MLTKLHEGEAYLSRPAHSIPVPLSLDPETAKKLELRAPGKRSRSKYITGLIQADFARQEERQRLVALVHGAQVDDERDD